LNSETIEELEGKCDSWVEYLKEKLGRYKKGEAVTLTVKRPSNKGYEEKEIQLTLKGQDSMKNATAESESKDGQDSRDSGSERRNGRGDSGNRSDSNSGDNSNEDGSLFPFQW